MLFDQQLPYLLVRISPSYYVKLGTLMKTYNLMQSETNNLKESTFKYNLIHFPKSMKPSNKLQLKY
jgi:hypothetical protein